MSATAFQSAQEEQDGQKPRHITRTRLRRCRWACARLVATQNIAYRLTDRRCLEKPSGTPCCAYCRPAASEHRRHDDLRDEATVLVEEVTTGMIDVRPRRDPSVIRVVDDALGVEYLR